jgi:hypothetical protein
MPKDPVLKRLVFTGKGRMAWDESRRIRDLLESELGSGKELTHGQLNGAWKAMKRTLGNHQIKSLLNRLMYG